MTLLKRFPGWTPLSDFFEDDWWKTRFTNGDWMPAVNIVDNENNYEIEVAAPGFKKNDFHVTVENGIMTIRAESNKEKEEKKRNYTRREFSSRSFSKSFTLPGNVEEEDISAAYDDGVLKLMMKKTTTKIPPRKEVTIK